MKAVNSDIATTAGRVFLKVEEQVAFLSISTKIINVFGLLKLDRLAGEIQQFYCVIK